MATLSLIDLTWCHLGASLANLFCCLVCGASAELNLLSHSGGSCFCIHSALPPALRQRQPSLLTVSEMYLCVKGPHCWISWRITVFSLCLKRSNKTCHEMFYFLKPAISICITTSPQVTVSLFFFFCRFGSSNIPTCTELRSFVFLCLCHRLAGVSPQSPVWGSECDSLGGNCFTACLSPLLSQHSNGCTAQKGTVP